MVLAGFCQVFYGLSEMEKPGGGVMLMLLCILPDTEKREESRANRTFFALWLKWFLEGRQDCAGAFDAEPAGLFLSFAAEGVAPFGRRRLNGRLPDFWTDWEESSPLVCDGLWTAFSELA